ncbi:MAG TPA: hypothetical protein VEL76_02755 [Gemmataceae bacterium]|nr:hypothetical protein [Gemmataceae bacterium]
MKLSSQLAQLKQRKQKQKQLGLQGGHGKGSKWGLRQWAVLALCLALVGAGTWAVFEFFIWARLPSGLVGKWVVQGGPMAGGTFEFGRSGTLETRIKDGATVYTLKARATVEDKTLRTTTANPATGTEETRTSLIRELTEKTLILELEKGQVVKMVRDR